jgi:hypothetical protein
MSVNAMSLEKQRGMTSKGHPETFGAMDTLNFSIVLKVAGMLVCQLF